MARSGSVAHLLCSLTRSGESMASAGQNQAMQNILSSKLQTKAENDKMVFFFKNWFKKIINK